MNVNFTIHIPLTKTIPFETRPHVWLNSINRNAIHVNLLELIGNLKLGDISHKSTVPHRQHKVLTQEGVSHQLVQGV